MVPSAHAQDPQLEVRAAFCAKVRRTVSVLLAGAPQRAAKYATLLPLAAADPSAEHRHAAYQARSAHCPQVLAISRISKPDVLAPGHMRLLGQLSAEHTGCAARYAGTWHMQHGATRKVIAAQSAIRSVLARRSLVSGRANRMPGMGMEYCKTHQFLATQDPGNPH